jgi:hypothetical protein
MLPRSTLARGGGRGGRGGEEGERERGRNVRSNFFIDSPTRAGQDQARGIYPAVVICNFRRFSSASQDASQRISHDRVVGGIKPRGYSMVAEIPP